HQGYAVPLVAHGGIVDGHLLAARDVSGDTPLNARHEEITQADVGERAPHHDFVIAAARAVGVEIDRFHALLDEVTRRGARLRDVAGRGDVIGRYRVTQDGEGTGAMYVRERGRRHGHAFEVRRVLHIGRAGIPGIALARGNLDAGPILIAGEHAGIAFPEHLRVDGAQQDFLHFLVAGPDLGEAHRLAGLVLAERLAGEIDIERTGESVGHD